MENWVNLAKTREKLKYRSKIEKINGEKYM